MREQARECKPKRNAKELNPQERATSAEHKTKCAKRASCCTRQVEFWRVARRGACEPKNASRSRDPQPQTERETQPYNEGDVDHGNVTTKQEGLEGYLKHN